ncbi:redox-sensitive transcriptional activator SoxR [Actibacterium sp. 188UL27-1]|uniref:redox-sensitive transcriptional activator SoxR n=1 Tax=Actibacterium sp. 188UL27-1 TaxID=2786961 RepID=UPI00195C0C61|nr:redox-sensitive transcriptional activator SoxR [Actibacterium sp. 188UL27-1]MBM7068109.1 redox-sensitive transcriptional activator SoxR [Actibacterium sp. 188UL27-1]
MPLQQELSIGQVARRTGLAVSAIRYYDAKGLICSNRNAGGQRRFERSMIRRLAFIQIAQQFGFTLEQIQMELAALPRGRTPNEADWVRIGTGMRAELDRQIATLTRLRDNLDGCIGCGCLSLKRCALYNAKDTAGEKGAGPRYLMGDRPEGV